MLGGTIEKSVSQQGVFDLHFGQINTVIFMYLVLLIFDGLIGNLNDNDNLNDNLNPIGISNLF